jgi:hypothetical protein
MRSILVEQAAALVDEIGSTRERILNLHYPGGLLCHWGPERKQSQKRSRNAEPAYAPIPSHMRSL